MAKMRALDLVTLAGYGRHGVDGLARERAVNGGIFRGFLGTFVVAEFYFLSAGVYGAMVGRGGGAGRLLRNSAVYLAGVAGEWRWAGGRGFDAKNRPVCTAMAVAVCAFANYAAGGGVVCGADSINGDAAGTAEKPGAQVVVLRIAAGRASGLCDFYGEGAIRPHGFRFPVYGLPFQTPEAADLRPLPRVVLLI